MTNVDVRLPEAPGVKSARVVRVLGSSILRVRYRLTQVFGNLIPGHTLLTRVFGGFIS